MNGTVVGGDESGSPVVAYDAKVLVDSPKRVATPASASMPATPDLSTDAETTDSENATPEGGRSRASTGPLTRTTITTTSTTAGDSEAKATTIQYSNVTGVELSEHVEKDGTIHLKPVQARKDRKVKIKKVIQFVPRISHFDRDHPDSKGDTFRGFYVLFWMLMGLALIRTFYHSYLNTGEVVGLRFAKLITGDAIVLALSDAVLVGSTILCVPFIKLVEKGWIRYHYTGVIIQHTMQCLYLATAIRWTFHRQWYWVQSGFLTLHSLTMLMKVHSYLAMNGAFAEKRIQLEKTRKQLDNAVEEQGGWSKILYQVSRESLQTEKASSKDTSNGHLGVSSAPSKEELRSTGEAAESPLFRRRRSSNRSSSSENTDLLPDPKDPRRLVDYSDERIYNLANDCVDLQEELTSTGKEPITWPANVTYANYIDYLLVPSLVYELEYPRTSTIRPLYVLEKTLATFGTFFVIYAITEHVIFPSHEASKANPIRADSFIGAALDLILPFMLNYLLIFYIIFECICNAFAELTRFADRGFYEDWWNAVTWDEFARKWNKPVHQFLLRHVYASTIKAFRLSKFQASFLTFLLSACIHELVMAVVSKKFRMYLFMMQMAQLPMIAMGRLPFLRRYPTIGNISFWAGLIWGFPLLAIGYLRF